MKYVLIAAFTLAVLATPAVVAQEAPAVEAPVPEPALELPDVTATALEAQGNAPNGPLGPPPDQPSNACEAQCVAEFFQCQRICSRNPCLIACETLFDLCVESCTTV